MRVHHLNTGTMCPRGGRLVSGSGGLFARARLVCHCLLIESDDGLVLVDTGIGTGDIAAPARLGARWVRQAAPLLDASETALQQVKALGFSPDDVRHILLTHLDRDHAGGIGDFPKAKVHVHRGEHAMAVEGLSLIHIYGDFRRQGASRRVLFVRTTDRPRRESRECVEYHPRLSRCVIASIGSN